MFVNIIKLESTQRAPTSAKAKISWGIVFTGRHNVSLFDLETCSKVIATGQNTYDFLLVF